MTFEDKLKDKLKKQRSL